jgi:antitoxin MazE
MVKTLSSIGNSLGLIIDRPILDLLQITKDTPLEITTDGESLTIRPVAADSKKSRIRASGKRMMGAHAVTLQKLAK